MIDFMVIALPRSGTTWAANWLTTEATYCAHDPLWNSHYRDLDARIADAAGDRIKGIACTGLWNWPDWLNEHPARKIILHRGLAQIRRSMSKLGLPLPDDASDDLLHRIHGRHASHLNLFRPDGARVIWEYLTELPFDEARHAQLRQMRIEPHIPSLDIDSSIVRGLMAEVGKA